MSCRSLAAARASRFKERETEMNDTIIFSVFADLHWREGDWTWCEARLDAIFARALQERAEFIIHCGDFCHDVTAARGFTLRSS